MNCIDKERSIKEDIASIENRVRHAFNQGYDFGFKDGKEKAKSQEPVIDKIRAELIQPIQTVDLMVENLTKRFEEEIAEQGECKEESEAAQPKQTADSCLDFDFDKVKEILKKDGLDNLIVDHTCEEKQDQIRDEKMIDTIEFAIKATDSQDDYGMGMRNGMRYVKSLIDGKEPQYESRRTDEEIKLGIDIGDEVIGNHGVKGVVVGIDTYKGRPWLSLLMKNHKVPQLVDASEYKTKTGRHFPQIIEVLEQIKGEADGK